MKRVFVGVMLAIFLTGVLFFALEVQPARAGESIIINADGSVEGTTSIQTIDNATYFLVADINGSIGVARDNVVLEGAGHTVYGNGWMEGKTGIYVGGSDLAYRTNVTVQNLQVTDFDCGIYLVCCFNCTIMKNNITSNYRGISFLNAERVDISRNNLVANYIGINVNGREGSGNNKIYHNNFLQNTVQVFVGFGSISHVWDDGYPGAGNYWSDYNGTDLCSGQFQNESGSDGIGDSSYDIMFLWQHMGEYWMVVGQDHYPLTTPFGSNLPLAYCTADFTYAPIEPIASEPMGFDASTSICSNGTIIRYSWDFGDGEISAGQTVSHIYRVYGNYNVSLTTVSSTFISDNKNQSIYVRQAPTANFSFSSNPVVGYPITFDASASEPKGGSITAYVWDFGDDNMTSTDNPIIDHKFTRQNSFNATLTVLDSEGLNSSFSKSFLVMMPTFLSIHTSSSSSIVGYAVNINGILEDFYGVPLENKTVVLSYTFPGATNWLQITSANTNSLGEYHATWIPTATGAFTLKAKCDGNATHSDADSTVSLSTLSYTSGDVFSIESNSTISEMSVNSERSKLTFSVSGEEHTVGYVRITMAKGFAKSGDDVKVYLDGVPMTFTVTSTDSSWTITSTYMHSTHSFEVDLTSGASVNMPAWGFWAIVVAAASVAVVLTIALVVMGVRRSKVRERGKSDLRSSLSC